MTLADLPSVLLMGPGPSPVHPRILEALSKNTLGHLDIDFLDIMNETVKQLRNLFETKNNITFPVSGTGSAGMEAALVNLIEPGDVAVIGVNGVFGQRMAEVAKRCGADVIIVEAEWGCPIPSDKVEEALSSLKEVKLVGLVHAETSTGVQQPLSEIVDLAHRHDALMLVDAVTSLGGLSVGVDSNKLDVVYSGTQKCIGAPPGLAPITFGENALKCFDKRKSVVQSWYLDLSFLTRYWGEERFYHHTAPVNMIYGLYEALAIIHEEGLEDRFTRHRQNANALVAGLEALKLEMVVPSEYRLPSLISVRIPNNIDDLEVRKLLRQDHLIEIGGGLGPFKGEVWRIGLMGYGSTRDNVELLIKVMGKTLSKLGHKCSVTEALAEVEKSY